MVKTVGLGLEVDEAVGNVFEVDSSRLSSEGRNDLIDATFNVFGLFLHFEGDNPPISSVSGMPVLLEVVLGLSLRIL